MILKLTELEAIKRGERTVVFRRWFRPGVKSGGALRTAVGVLRFDDVRVIESSQVDAQDAVKAGYPSLAELLRFLDQREGDIYRIELHYEGSDPRLELRENDTLSAAELLQLLTKLSRLDTASKHGPWTLNMLSSLERHPKVASVQLAKKLGYEQLWLKTNVRKLKNLGLTMSHEVGYELSPRGRAVLRALLQQQLECASKISP